MGWGGGAAGTDGGLGPVAAAALRPGAPGGRRWRLPGPAARNDVVHWACTDQCGRSENIAEAENRKAGGKEEP